MITPIAGLRKGFYKIRVLFPALPQKKEPPMHSALAARKFLLRISR